MPDNTQKSALEKALVPSRFEALPSDEGSVHTFRHWFRTFERYCNFIKAEGDNALGLLENLISTSVSRLIEHCNDYDEAIAILKSLYDAKPNPVAARHKLSCRLQKPGETVQAFASACRELAIDCGCKAVSAEENMLDLARDAFIKGLSSTELRSRLLECEKITFKEACTKAAAYSQASAEAASMGSSNIPAMVAAASTPHVDEFSNSSAGIETAIPPPSPSISDYQSENSGSPTVVFVSAKNSKCDFCISKVRHPREHCPAKNAVCRNCSKLGHFASRCRGRKRFNNPKFGNNNNNQYHNFYSTKNSFSSAALCSKNTTYSLSSLGENNSLNKACCTVLIKNISLKALIDTGSSENFISEKVINKAKINIKPFQSNVILAASNSATIIGECKLDFKMQDTVYKGVNFLVLPNLVTDVILGHPFFKLHEGVTINFSGDRPPLIISSLVAMEIATPPVFSFMSPTCKPIATKSRHYSQQDHNFINSEISRLLEEGIIEPSRSPWRAQVLVAKQPSSGRRRLVVDYSQTVNKFTYLDAYPLPKIDDVVNKISQYRIFSSIDLKSAYHQVPLSKEDKPYTAFEAGGKLYQYTRLSFGLTNGVACFQRIIDHIVDKCKLSSTFPYVDDVTICGMDQSDHDRQLEAFFEAAKQYKLTLNLEKCKFSQKKIKLLGYEIEHGKIRPDPDRLTPLFNMPTPTSPKALDRLVGLFAYYSKWIPHFSNRVHPLIKASFPLSSEALVAIEDLKQAVATSVRGKIDENLPFVVETDASDIAVAATLNQGGQPVAFFSRTLSKTEQKHCSMEKEACAIVEAVRKWHHFLAGRKFTLVTDQEALSYMFNLKLKSKIKNDKVLRWRMELLPYSYEVRYRPGHLNSAADALSRAVDSGSFHTVGDSYKRVPNKEAISNSENQLSEITATSSNEHSINACLGTHIPVLATSGSELVKLHNELGHPGVTRFLHYVKAKNLPYSTEEVKNVVKGCQICAKVKPNFYKPPTGTLIKATQPFERLAIDFKVQLPTTKAQNSYLFIAVDEYSRYPFAYPCRDMSSETVIQCLANIFHLFGAPKYIHSDNGSYFKSHMVRNFLFENGVANSFSSKYHPPGNGQCERYVGTIWKTVLLTRLTHNLLESQWDCVVQEALGSIRSLLCTATNCTPHERLMGYPRNNQSSIKIPHWLRSTGPVYLRQFIRNKADPLVEEVQLVEANNHYAKIKHKDGRFDSVSTSDLAPFPSPALFPAEHSQPYLSTHNQSNEELINSPRISSNQPVFDSSQLPPPPGFPAIPTAQTTPFDVLNSTNPSNSYQRCSSRIKRPPDRLNLYVAT